MSYTYTTGQGLAAMTASEPSGTEPFLNLSPAIRQIKAYLNDPTVGPEAKLALAAAGLASLIASQSAAGSVPVGTVAHCGHGNLTASSGWLYCDGRELSRTEYKALFDVIGVSYGPGNNINTFNIPPAYGRALVGIDSGRNLLRESPADSSSPFLTIGKSLGEQKVAVVEETMPVHSHPPSSTAGYKHFASFNKGAFRIHDVYPMYASMKLFEVGETKPEGESEPHNNLQPSLALYTVIKYK